MNSIRGIVDPDAQRRAFDRVSALAGPDEYHLASSWLDVPGVFAMAEDNENHAGEHNVAKLARACAVFPDAQWFTASDFEGRPAELLSIIDPAAALEWGAAGESPLGAVCAGQSFVFFSLDEPAVILYSEHEYALITGSEAFVTAYFGDLDDAARDLESFFAERRDIWSDRQSMLDAIDRQRAAVLPQLRRPQLPIY